MRISDWSSDVCSSDLQEEGMRRPGSILAMALMASPAMASDPAYDSAVEAVQLRMDEIDRQEGRIPGRVLVFAKAGEEPIVDARGVRNIERGDPVNADTPFYVASKIGRAHV